MARTTGEGGFESSSAAPRSFGASRGEQNADGCSSKEKEAGKEDRQPSFSSVGGASDAAATTTTPSDAEPAAPAATSKYLRSPTLVWAIPWQIPPGGDGGRAPTASLPIHLLLLARALALVVPSLFYLGPLMVALPPILYVHTPRAALLLLVVDAILVLYPTREWPAFRRLFRLWYVLFDLRHNLAVPPDDASRPPDWSERQNRTLCICAMHPHGIIPIQGFLWSAFCDQYMPNLYGVGAATDAAVRLPFLRQVLGWLSTKGAGRDVLASVLASGTNLFILPGGVAEIFLSRPGCHTVKARRKGLMKLALQTGASLVPVYVFGGNDFYCQLATVGGHEKQGDDNGRCSGGCSTEKSERDGAKDDERSQSRPRPRRWLRRSLSSNYLGAVQERISRSARAGFTIWWGRWGTTMPFGAKCSLVLGDAIEPIPGTLGEGTAPNGAITCRKVPNPTKEQVEELLDRYIDSLVRLFDQYKAEAGYPDATLEIL